MWRQALMAARDGTCAALVVALVVELSVRCA